MSQNNSGLEAFSNKLFTIENKLNDILNGAKLYLDPEQPLDALWIDQIHAFYPDDFDDSYNRNLDSAPKMYYITPEVIERGDENILLEADTSVHPLHLNLINAERSLRRGAEGVGLTNVAVAGADIMHRDPRFFDDAISASENFFLHAKGDVVSLAQTVRALRHIVDNPDLHQRSILIDNTSERYMPVLKMLDLDFQEGVDWLNEELKARGQDAVVGVSDESGTAIGHAKELAYTPKKAFTKTQINCKNLFFETSSDEKIEDTTRNFHRNRFDVGLNHANDLLGHSEHAPEWKWSFGGNALDKLKLTLKDKLLDSDLDQYLKSKKLSREDAFIMVADGGESYNMGKELRQTPCLSRVALLKTHPYSEFPGSETKPFSQEFGTKSDDYDTRFQAFKDIEDKTGKKADTRFVDNCIVLIAPLAQDDLDNPVYYAVKAKQTMKSVFEPKPSYHIHKNQRHYQKFEGVEMTVAELEEDGDDLMFNGLAISQAMTSLGRAANFSQKPVDLNADFDTARKFEVTSPWPIPDDQSFEQDFDRQGLDLVSGKPVESFKDVRKVMRRSDALFFPNVPDGQGESFWASRILLPISTIVAKQLRDPYVNGSPMVSFAEENQDRPEFEKMLDHLKRSGMIQQDMHYLYNRAKSVTGASRFIQDKLSGASSAHDEFKDHNYQPLPHTGNQDICAFLLSASSAYEIDNDHSYQATVNFGLNGFDVVTGLGEQNPMGWSSFASLQLIREGFDHNVQGIQDPFAMRTEGWPKEHMDRLMGPEHAVVAPDIFVRIEEILKIRHLQENPDAKLILVSQANGAGGLQEMAAFMALREMGVAGTERIHMIVENAPRETQGGLIRPHDAFLDLVDRRDDMRNIYEASDPKETLKIASGIVGRDLIHFDVERSQNTPFPFAREKHDFFDWFVNLKGEHDVPDTTIRDVYDRTMALHNRNILTLD